MNAQMTHNTMQEYVDDEVDTLSLSNFLTEDDATYSDVLSKPSFSSKSTSSSSSLSEHDFLGFFTEEWSKNSTAYGYASENIVFCGKVVSSKSQTEKLFRSSSDSFRFIRSKTASRKAIGSRSKSMPDRSASCKSRLMVFMFGSGSSKFPTKLEKSDIKSRKLSTSALSRVDSAKSGLGTSGKNGWWRVVDVLGCNGGYKRDIANAI